MRTKTLLATLALSLLALALNPPCLFAQANRVQLTLKGAWPGHPLGPAEGRALVVSNRAYVPIAYAGLAIINVSNPTNLVPVGGIANRGSACVAGHYAYLTTEATWTGWGYAGGDLEILDVSDPARPLRVAGYDTEGGASVVHVAGNHAYVAEGGVWTGSNYLGVVEILNVSDPAQPTRVGDFSFGGSIIGLQVVGNYAYLAERPSCGETNCVGALKIFDVSDPANPLRVGRMDLGEFGRQVENFHVGGRYACFAEERWTGPNRGGTLEIVDVGDPANPSRVGSYDTRAYIHDVHVAGDYAYLAEGLRYTGSNYTPGILEVIDLHDPAHPVRVGAWEAMEQAYGVQVVGQFAYLGTSYGLLVFDVDDPVSPVLLGSYDTSRSQAWAQHVQVAGHHAYVAEANWSDTNPFGALVILDVSDPAYPAQMSRYRAVEQVSAVQVVGQYAYLAEGTWRTGTNDAGALEILDVRDPTRPVNVGGIATRGSANRVHVAGDLAYVAEGTRWTGSNLVGALEVFCVSNPASPTLVSRFETNGSINDVEVAGRYAYLAGGDADLHVIDVTDPASPRWVASYSTNVSDPDLGEGGGPSLNVKVVGNYVYVVGGDGLHVLDVSDPAHPVPVRVGHGLPFRGLDVADGYASIAFAIPDGLNAPHGYLAILDVSDPVRPVGTGGWFEGTGLIATATKIVGNHLYVAAGQDGLLVFEITERPCFTSVSRSGDNLVLTWNGAAGLKLQRTSSLASPDWRDVTGSESTNQVRLPLGSGHEFFRLVQP